MTKFLFLLAAASFLFTACNKNKSSESSSLADSILTKFNITSPGSP